MHVCGRSRVMHMKNIDNLCTLYIDIFIIFMYPSTAVFSALHLSLSPSVHGDTRVNIPFINVAIGSDIEISIYGTN